MFANCDEDALAGPPAATIANNSLKVLDTGVDRLPNAENSSRYVMPVQQRGV
jgi:hypothetical protein